MTIVTQTTTVTPFTTANSSFPATKALQRETASGCLQLGGKLPGPVVVGNDTLRSAVRVAQLSPKHQQHQQQHHHPATTMRQLFVDFPSIAWFNDDVAADVDIDNEPSACEDNSAHKVTTCLQTALALVQNFPQEEQQQPQPEQQQQQRPLKRWRLENAGCGMVRSCAVPSSLFSLAFPPEEDLPHKKTTATTNHRSGGQGQLLLPPHHHQFLLGAVPHLSKEFDSKLNLDFLFSDFAKSPASVAARRHRTTTPTKIKCTVSPLA